ncbi:MAG: YbjN domain-containing protein [Terrimicrobiaceae bacterium]|nr:YbjN domain-containing protein [Terrimicrobiaceae bacterium]
MNNDPLPPASLPLEVIRQTLDDADIRYQDAGDLLMMVMALRHVEVQVFCSGEPDDLASIIVRLPVRATPDRIPAVAEFLHRLNWNARRKFWELDADSGEIRLSGYTDTISGPLTGDLFQRLLDAILTTADTSFPYLTSVMNGRMNPAFAADQTEAALGS